MISEQIIKIVEEQGYKRPTTILELIENNHVLLEAVAQVLDLNNS